MKNGNTKKKNQKSELLLQASEDSLVQRTTQANADYPVDTFIVNLGDMYEGFVRWHWHNQVEIDVLLQGKAMYHVNDKYYELTEGQGIFINKGVMHSVRPIKDEPCVFRSIIFDADYILSPAYEQLSIDYVKPVIENPSLPCLIFDGTESFHHNLYQSAKLAFETNVSNVFGYELETRKYLTDFWILLVKYIKNMNPKTPKSKNQLTIDQARIKASILYIQQHYAEAVTLDEIAASAKISKGECCRCFNRMLHMTPFDYLMQYRILMAVNIMSNPPVIPMSELAETVGFNSSSYFNKVFRKVLKCTPTQYRKNYVNVRNFPLDYMGFNTNDKKD